jgi:hypothetical protein
LKKQLLRRRVKGVWIPGPLRVIGHSPFWQAPAEGQLMTEHNSVDHARRLNGATIIDRSRPCLWIRTDAERTVITISGEIDASDIEDMSPYAQKLVRDSGVLIIDLHGIDFIAADALRALFTLWSPDPAPTEPPRAHVMRICSERITIELRRG